MNNDKLIKIYLKQANERLESAQALVNIKNYRDAMSRAYYAFFDAATAALITKNLSAKTHHGVNILFENNFIKTGKFPIKIGRWLTRAQQAREEADYELAKEVKREVVVEAIKVGKEFVVAIKKLVG